jgi:glutamate 5-kinase
MRHPVDRLRQEANLRLLTEARRVVVKVGSSLLIDEGSGELNQRCLDSLADDVARLRWCDRQFEQ